MNAKEWRKPAPPQGRPRTVCSATEQRNGHDRCCGQLDLLAMPPEPRRSRPGPGRDSAETSTDGWWLSCALAAVAELARSGRNFQAYDVTDMGVPEPDHASRWGPLMARAARDGLVVVVGAERSRRPTTRGALCRVWRGVPPNVDEAR